MRRNRKLNIGIFTFNFGKRGLNSITTKVGPVKLNSKGRVSFKKGPMSLSFKFQKSIFYIIVFTMFVLYFKQYI